MTLTTPYDPTTTPIPTLFSIFDLISTIPTTHDLMTGTISLLSTYNSNLYGMAQACECSHVHNISCTKAHSEQTLYLRHRKIHVSALDTPEDWRHRIADTMNLRFIDSDFFPQIAVSCSEMSLGVLLFCSCLLNGPAGPSSIPQLALFRLLLSTVNCAFAIL